MDKLDVSEVYVVSSVCVVRDLSACAKNEGVYSCLVYMLLVRPKMYVMSRK